MKLPFLIRHPWLIRPVAWVERNILCRLSIHCGVFPVVTRIYWYHVCLHCWNRDDRVDELFV